MNRPITFKLKDEWITLHNGYCGWAKPGDAYSRFVEAHALICPKHRTHLKWTALKATYNPDKVCDFRCVGAKRASCECACGGANHGTGLAG
ncbi:hypothetical protein [Nocardia tengchongensis]|uniref:hypothetical protein n=1 Tax=Nocardia tengchongensis TaxID=2055889 RepID=UPI00365CFBB3